MSNDEIESAHPVSLLYQIGYLTIRSISQEGDITLDYPNNEVLRSTSRLYLGNMYGVPNGVNSKT